MYPDDDDDYEPEEHIVAQGGMIALIAICAVILAIGFILGWVIMSRC